MKSMSYESNGLIDRYKGLPVCEFRELLEILPNKLQEDLVIVMPHTAEFSMLASAVRSDSMILSMNCLLPTLSLTRDGIEMPIPPAYSDIFHRMEAIIQDEYKKSIVGVCNERIHNS